jgi:2-C-methyl-D-erythritol 4-phosphate cytidylyltransferase/2-C-methyl-D-erythritol 2,4-cyclodiphosphate synthase
MSAAALIVAAGSGVRAGGDLPKQFQMLGDRAVLRWSVDAFRACRRVGPIMIVRRDSDDADVRAIVDDVEGVAFVDGGDTRTDSVRAGLAALQSVQSTAVIVHDAARPGVTPDMIARLLDELDGFDGAAPALQVVDALKRTDAVGVVLDDVSRVGLWRIQTPQAFRSFVLTEAYRSLPVGAVYEDDVAVARATVGARVKLIPGEQRLLKITYPEDFDMILRLFGGKSVPCVGTGFDAHRFGPGDHLTLCGVRIPHDKGLIGHSDADAAWHALTDAILGALGEGDIGDHFPPSDPQWKGADSEVFLSHALKLAKKRKATLVHVDVTILCERPKVKPHRERMRQRTAETLGLPLERVSVKATTTERLGFLGREEGLAAQAAATLLVKT